MVLMESIFEAMAPTVSVLIMIAVLFYIFAILFTEFIGHSPQFEGDEFIHERFGTVGNSLITLLQILTLGGARKGERSNVWTVSPCLESAAALHQIANNNAMPLGWWFPYSLFLAAKLPQFKMSIVLYCWATTSR
jgi:hypothetical protein